MIKIQYMFSVILLLLLSGCVSPPISYQELRDAEELVISEGKEYEKRYKGEALAEYLSTFKESRMGLVIISGKEEGEIKVDGHWYPVEYWEEKAATRPAIITIMCDPNPIQIRQNIQP